jgi:type VI secretion system secreted protein VgrG
MNLIALLMSALSGPITQASRLLRLHTPLGPDVLLAERAVVVESIGPHACEHVPGASKASGDPRPRGGFAIQIDVLCIDTHLELKTLIGQPVLLELLTQASRVALRPFHGHVTSFTLLGSDGGLARYRLIVEPWLAFAAHTQDSRVFQSMSVPAIVDAVFGSYSGRGRLAPAWRWDLADASVYPERSLCVQYQESDLDFVMRLLSEEGIVCWFEHEGAVSAAGVSGDAALGTHTLVLADHGGAFAANSQAVVRFTQSGASMAEDSLVRFNGGRAEQTSAVRLSSPDYRAAGAVAVSQASADAGAMAALELQDVPGQYTYEDRTQGERLALRRQQALDARAAVGHARGPWRTAQVGTTFTLIDHHVHDGMDDARDRFVVLASRHAARNNLTADVKAALAAALGSSESPPATRDLTNDSAEPLFDTALELQPAALEVRRLPKVERAQRLPQRELPDARLSPRPNVHGVQTAIVVGLGAPIHTDRDHRVKVQFHWQRGDAGSHRALSSSGGSGAPASDASGTWVRVGEAMAGANWGSNFIPRVGQEVLVAFTGGDIDRPVVVGSVYNGTGQANAQGNRVSGGAAGSTGDAPAWFPGSKASGALQGHQHAHVLAGFKTQALGSSASGTGGYNQLVFDDSPAVGSSGGGRIELSTTQAATRLQLGKLLHQSDNQRLNPRGHGLDLTTQAYGAVRAGSGVLISAWHDANAKQIDARPAQAVLDAASQLTQTLTQSAQDHEAMLQGEPLVKGAKPGEASKQLPVQLAQFEQHESLAATDARGDPGDGTDATISGGAGTVPAWSRPELLIAAPAGIGAYTPAHHLWSAGSHISLNAGQDVQQLAQRHHALAAKDGIVLYTYGRAGNPNKPNQEVGIKLHAASGNVNVQSQSAATHLTADKSVDVASTHGMVQITAPKHILLTAAGAAIRIQQGNITLSGPGKVEFRASMKVLTSMGAASQSLSLKGPAELRDCAFKFSAVTDNGGAVVF